MRHFKRNNFDYSTVLNVVVDMKPISLAASSSKNNNKRSQVEEAIHNIECVYCECDITFESYVRCTQCTLSDGWGKCVDVVFCIPCYEMGAENGKHKRGHNYKVINRCGPSVFIHDEEEDNGEEEEGEETWGAFEELRLLELAQHHKINDWSEICYNEFGKERTVEDARAHLQQYFINTIFGKYANSKVNPSKIHITGLRYPEIYNGDLFSPAKNGKKEKTNKTSSISSHVPISKSLRRLEPYTQDELEKVVCRFSNVHIDHDAANDTDQCYITSTLTKLGEKPVVNVKSEKKTHSKETPVKKRKERSPKKEEKIIVKQPEPEELMDFEDSEDEEPKAYPLRRRSSPRRTNYRLDDSPEHDNNRTYPTRKRGQKRVRKFTISPVKSPSRSRSRPKKVESIVKQKESTPQTPTFVKETSRRKSKDMSADVTYLPLTAINNYRISNPYLNFFTNSPPMFSKQQIRAFDYEDLVLVAYNPKRDDFEHEYRNSAEQFICRIFLNGDSPIESEVDLFKTAVQIAKVQRYNRVLERRITNHAICREHQILNEFLTIVKTNVNERNKYTVFGEDSFPSKKRAEECRPFFAKLRRVLDKDELTELADNIGEMEALMNRIKVLRALQTSGTTELKGRFKSDFTPGRKRKKARKNDYELKKAELRWNRIKRWNKQNKDE